MVNVGSGFGQWRLPFFCILNMLFVKGLGSWRSMFFCLFIFAIVLNFISPSHATVPLSRLTSDVVNSLHARHAQNPRHKK